LEIRKIKKSDNAAVGKLIRTVMPEFGAAGPGFAIHDPEVDQMFETYNEPRSGFFVIEEKGEIFGCGGIGPLAGGDGHTCELRKMYFLPALRGKGFGQKLLNLCLEEAKKLKYKTCYLETLAAMTQARKLYEQTGFKKLGAPLGATGHFGCNSWYSLNL
jgi:putative acetyltransferase